MKKIQTLTLIILSLILFSCKPDYHYDFKIKVFYTNGDTEILNVSDNSFNGLEVKISLITRKGAEPDLYIICGGYSTQIASGVRRYEILEQIKYEINCDGEKSIE